MGKFGWDYPPGAANDPFAPYNQIEQPLDLTEELQRCGRVGHGLCGKDADLDYGGQIVVKSCFWFADDSVKAEVEPYASIVPPQQGDDETDEAYERSLEMLTEVIVGCGYPGEWDGDYWVMTMGGKRVVSVDVSWDDGKSDAENRTTAVEAINRAIFADPAIVAFQKEMKACAKAMERKEEDG